MKDSIICYECGFEASGKYCSSCGLPLTIRRITGEYIVEEIRKEFLFEKGYFFTIKEIFFNPSKTIKEFISQNRNKFIKPIIFLFITTIIFVLSNYLVNSLYKREFNYDTEKVKDISNSTNFILFEVEMGATDILISSGSFLNDYYGYTYILLILFLASIFRINFYNSKYNFYETFVMLCYVISVQILIIIPINIILFFLVKNGLLDTKMLGIETTSLGFWQYEFYTKSGVISSIYSIWAIGMFYGGKIKSFIISFISYYVGNFFLFWALGFSIAVGLNIYTFLFELLKI